MDSQVADFIRNEVPDWDDDVIATARFKAFSGQRSDWEARFQFWRDLIIKVARHLNLIIIDTEEVKNKWFVRGGLTPLCLSHVMLEMYRSGDLLKNGDLVDQPTAHIVSLFKQVMNLIGLSTSTVQGMVEGKVVVTVLVQERAAQVTSTLAHGNWSSHCVATIGRFQNLCQGFEESGVIMSYLMHCRRARYLLIDKEDRIEGVKISLAPATVPNVSQLDYDMLHLYWTLERLQQQLDVLDRRCEKSKSSALIAVKAGNKQVALRHARCLKMALESKEKCTGFMDRVEEVLGLISDAESTKKVNEAIQLGTQAIKEHGISIEEVHASLQHLDECITSQKQIEDSLEVGPFLSGGMEDDDIEDEFARLEMELEDETLPVTMPALKRWGHFCQVVWKMMILRMNLQDLRWNLKMKLYQLQCLL